MSKQSRREHVQEGRPRPDGISSPDRSPETGVEEGERPGEPTPPLEPGMPTRYWVAIIVWFIGFLLMILYEIISSIWRG